MYAVRPSVPFSLSVLYKRLSFYKWIFLFNSKLHYYNFLQFSRCSCWQGGNLEQELLTYVGYYFRVSFFFSTIFEAFGCRRCTSFEHFYENKSFGRCEASLVISLHSLPWKTGQTKTTIPNAKPEVLKKLQQNLATGIGQKSVPFACHLELLRKYVIFLRSWEYREYSSLITLVSKHPILVMLPKRKK